MGANCVVLGIHCTVQGEKRKGHGLFEAMRQTGNATLLDTSDFHRLHCVLRSKYGGAVVWVVSREVRHACGLFPVRPEVRGC